MRVAVDFDNTIISEKGKSIPGAEAVLRELVAFGHDLILVTMRSSHHTGSGSLEEAVKWFSDHEIPIPLYGINSDPEQRAWTDSPKCFAHLVIDDICLGVPLCFHAKISHRPYVDWPGVRRLLIERKIIREIVPVI